MKAKEIREMSDEELTLRLNEAREQLGRMVFQHTITPAQNPMAIRRTRRLIARLETVKQQRHA